MKYDIGSFSYPSRDAYFVAKCKGKRVLHIGACDAPYTQDKLDSGLLLHKKINEVASEALGIDIDVPSIELLKGQGIENVVEFDIQNIAEILFSPEVIIFGETIEHLVDIGRALENLKSVMSEDTELLISTPNAYYIGFFIDALKSKESTHPDHTVLFSHRTLSCMTEKCGFEVREIGYTFLDRRRVRGKRKIWRYIAGLFPSLSETLIASIVSVKEKGEVK